MARVRGWIRELGLVNRLVVGPPVEGVARAPQTLLSTMLFITYGAGTQHR